MTDQALREELVAVARRMNASGLNQGTSGNLSARCPGGLLITPSSLPYEEMGPSDLVAINWQGQPLQGQSLQDGGRRPSSEWRLHADVLAARPELGAVLHCHPIHGTALACHDKGIPIEVRSEAEVTHMQGLDPAGVMTSVQLTPNGSPGFNPAFDVTPARLVTGLITERGVAEASEAGLQGLYADA